MIPLDPSRCPTCGQDNDCGQQCAPGGACWCFEQEIDPKLIESLPTAVQGKSCLCRACASRPATPRQR